MSITAAKWRTRSRRWAPQNGLMHRCAMYGSSRTTSPPHTGQFAGIFHPGFGSLTLTISGITSPARWIDTRAPTYTPFSLTCASLCMVTLRIVTPPTTTGLTCATGVSTPVRLRRAGGVERVRDRLQVAAGGHVGVDLAHAARGGVARVDEPRLARGLHLAVELLEARDREVDLTPDLEHVGQALGRRDVQGDAADRAHVGGDVLARGAVAAGGRALEPPLGVGHAHRQAVDLELGAVDDLVADRRSQPFVEGADLALVDG